MTFSIIHASARPNGWRASYDDWMGHANMPADIEYLLCVDSMGPFDNFDNCFDNCPNLPGLKIIWNGRRQCCVDAYNNGAGQSLGKILILNSDDCFSFRGWDDALLVILPDPDKEAVIEVSQLTEASDIRRIMTLQILTRKRYDRFWYVFYPEYESIYADCEFTDVARRDGVVINARHLVFEHRHPTTCKAAWDDVYWRENDPERVARGAALYDRRKALGFPEEVKQC